MQQPNKRKITQSTVEVTDVINPKQTAKPKTKFLSWFITIVPNLPFPDPNDPNLIPFANLLAQTIQDLFNDDEEIQNILNFNTRIKNRELVNVISEFQVERGYTKHLVHAHGILTIEHTSSFMLGYTKLQQHIRRDFSRACKKAGLPVPKGMYVNCDFLKEVSSALTTKQRIMEYITKNKKPITQLDKAQYGGSDWRDQFQDKEPAQQEEEHEDTVDTQLAKRHKADITELRRQYEQEEEDDESSQSVYPQKRQLMPPAPVYPDRNQYLEEEQESDEDVGEDDYEQDTYRNVPEPPKSKPQEKVPHIKWKLPDLIDMRASLSEQ
jgi:hypothetical protein